MMIKENKVSNEFKVEELEQRLEMRGWGNDPDIPGKCSGGCEIEF